MASPAANTVNDVDDTTVEGGGATDDYQLDIPGERRWRVGGGGGGGDDDDDDDESCHPIAPWIVTALNTYRLTQQTLEEFTRLLNMYSDGKDVERFKRASEGKPIEEPDPESADARSISFFRDDRADLMLTKSCRENYKLEVAVMASKFAYENAAAAKYLVETKLKGWDFEFFNCRNVILGQSKSTQAMAFVRKENGMDIMYVAFRGSDWESVDWQVNFDCGLIEMGKGFGKVHVGFMKALGLVRNTGSFDWRFPAVLPEQYWSDPPAYYAITRWLTREVARLKREKADEVLLRVVGHSQGGALAILFAAMLRYHETTAVDPAVVGGVEVITMGQPRVGNSVFARHMTEKVIRHGSSSSSSTGTLTDIVYTRMVYSYDPVPRLPSDDDPQRTKQSYSRYRHFGTCLYYPDWFKKLQFTDDKRMEHPNIDASSIFTILIDMRIAATDQRGRASELQELLQEPGPLVTHRMENWAAFQFHFLGEYLNAARHGEKPRPSSSLHGLLHFLLHPISSFRNRSRRRRVLITGDDMDQLVDCP